MGGGRDGGRGGYIHTLWSPTHVCFAIMLYIQPRGLCGEWAVGAGMRVGEEEREGAQNSSFPRNLQTLRPVTSTDTPACNAVLCHATGAKVSGVQLQCVREVCKECGQKGV